MQGHVLHKTALFARCTIVPCLEGIEVSSLPAWHASLLYAINNHVRTMRSTQLRRFQGRKGATAFAATAASLLRAHPAVLKPTPTWLECRLRHPSEGMEYSVRNRLVTCFPVNSYCELCGSVICFRPEVCTAPLSDPHVEETLFQKLLGHAYVMLDWEPPGLFLNHAAFNFAGSASFCQRIIASSTWFQHAATGAILVNTTTPTTCAWQRARSPSWNREAAWCIRSSYG
jgi:hypothetical protein